MKNQIQEFIRQGNVDEVQKTIENAPGVLCKADINQLIGFATYARQDNVIDILQKAAQTLTQDEETQFSSLNITNDLNKDAHENINAKTLLEDFEIIKQMLNDNQDIKSYIKNEELLTKHDEYNDILMHIACSAYISEQNQSNAGLLHSLKNAYIELSLDPNLENNFGVTPAEIIGDVDYNLAEELFS